MKKELVITVILIIGAYFSAIIIELSVGDLLFTIPAEGAVQVWAVHFGFNILTIILVAAIFGYIAGRKLKLPVMFLGMAMALGLVLPEIVSWPLLLAWAERSGIALSTTAHVVTYIGWLITPFIFAIFVYLGRRSGERNT